MPIAGTIDEAERSYIPALGKRWLLPLYDPFLWLLGADKAKQPLIEQAEIKAGFRVLDIGCGTGSMAIIIKRMHPEAKVVGIDPDPDALALSKRKAKRAGLSIEFDRGFADHMPYADASFDRVFSSFMFHHLAADEKTATLGEIRRVLKPGGSLHLLDFVHEHDVHSGDAGAPTLDSSQRSRSGSDRKSNDVADGRGRVRRCGGVEAWKKLLRADRLLSRHQSCGVTRRAGLL